MKRNSLMEECLQQISPEIKAEVDFSIKISKRLFDVMEKLGLTQRELARMLDKNETEISRWMQGTHNFTLQTIQKIESTLGMKILQVVGYDFDEIEYKDVVEKRIVIVYTKRHASYDLNNEISFNYSSVGRKTDLIGSC